GAGLPAHPQWTARAPARSGQAGAPAPRRRRELRSAASGPVGTASQVLVVGGGVTGCEAAWRAAELGAAVTLVTTSLDTVYALDGEPESAWAAPGSLLEAALEQGARSRWDVHRRAKYALEARRGVHLLQSTASSLLTQGSRVAGVETWEGVPRRGGAVALCVGTFLRARLRIGAVEERQG